MAYPYFEINDDSKIISIKELFDDDEHFENSNIYLRRIYREVIANTYRVFKNKEGERTESLDEDEFYVEFTEAVHTCTDIVVDNMHKSEKNLVISEYGVDYAYEKICETSEINQDIPISNQFTFVCLSEDILELDKLARNIVEVMLTDNKYYDNYRIMFEN